MQQAVKPPLEAQGQDLRGMEGRKAAGIHRGPALVPGVGLGWQRAEVSSHEFWPELGGSAAAMRLAKEAQLETRVENPWTSTVACAVGLGDALHSSQLCEKSWHFSARRNWEHVRSVGSRV